MSTALITCARTKQRYAVDIRGGAVWFCLVDEHSVSIGAWFETTFACVFEAIATMGNLRFPRD